MSAVVIDGRAFWWMLLAPRPSVRKLAGKLLVGRDLLRLAHLGPACRSSPRPRVIGWGLALKAAWLALWSAVLGSGLGVAIGLVFADWEWDIPKRMVKTVGRLLLVLVGGLYFVAAGFALGVFSAGSRGAVVPDVGWGRLVIAGGGIGRPGPGHPGRLRQEDGQDGVDPVVTARPSPSPGSDGRPTRAAHQGSSPAPAPRA